MFPHLLYHWSNKGPIFIIELYNLDELEMFSVILPDVHLLGTYGISDNSNVINQSYLKVEHWKKNIYRLVGVSPNSVANLAC